MYKVYFRIDMYHMHVFTKTESEVTVNVCFGKV
jgi:hypothetical protein